MYSITDGYVLKEQDRRVLADALRIAATHLRDDAKVFASIVEDLPEGRQRDVQEQLAKDFNARADAMETLLEDLS